MLTICVHLRLKISQQSSGGDCVSCVQSSSIKKGGGVGCPVFCLPLSERAAKQKYLQAFLMVVAQKRELQVSSDGD